MRLAHSVEVREPSHAFATAGDVFFVFWRMGVTLSATEALFELMDQQWRRRGTIGVLVTVYDGCELPPREAQAAISGGLEARSPALGHGVAIAIEGAGIGATLGRSVARTITLFSRHGYPSKVFAGSEDALAWLRGNGAGSELDEGLYRVIRDQVDQERSYASP